MNNSVKERKSRRKSQSELAASAKRGKARVSQATNGFRFDPEDSLTLDIKIPKPDSLPPAIVKPRGISLDERS